METPMSARRRTGWDRALILAFSAALLAPAVDSFVRPEARRDVELEARTPEPFPRLEPTLESVRAFPSGVERWYGDALGLRDVLLHHGSFLRVHVFHASPGEPLLVGRDEWIFPTLLGILDASRGRAQMTRARLETWRAAFESRRDFCASLGAEYRATLAPEKSSIYPERLPDGWTPIGPGVQDQLVAWLAARSDFRLVDLRPALRAEKARDGGSDFAYYPLGTHWTDRGALAVHAELLRALEGRVAGLASIAPDELAWELDPNEGDTWAHRLRLSSTLHQVARVLALCERDFRGEVVRADGVVRVGPRGAHPSVLVFHDSFGERVRKLLARSFASSTFVFAPVFDAERVRAERPDVVLELFAERRLLLDLPPAVPLAGEDRLARAFDASTERLWTFAPEREPAAWSSVDGTRARVELGALVVEQAEGETGLVELAVPPFPAGRPCLARVVVESDREDKLDVLYRTARQPRYHRGQVASAAVHPGTNVVHVRLDAEDLLGPLRVRCGARPGRSVLREVELRLAVP